MITARSVRRVTEDENWKMEEIEGVTGLPWDLNSEKNVVACL